jgi:hypothetical protein
MSKKTGAKRRLLETIKIDGSTHRSAMLPCTNNNRMPKKKASAIPPKLTDSEQLPARPSRTGLSA